MSKRMYKRGKAIRSLADFENSKSNWFIVYYGNKPKTTHRGWVESWQVHMLKNFIASGKVYEADKAD